MTHYRVSFEGRKRGSLPVRSHPCAAHVVADSPEQAKREAWDLYEPANVGDPVLVEEIFVLGEPSAQRAISSWCRSLTGQRQGAVMREVGGRPHVLDIRPRIAKTIASGESWLEVARAMGFRSEPGSGEAG